MMPTMQEIDEWEERGIRTDSVRARLFAAARRGVEENSAQDELNRIVDYIMGYWPAGFCYSHPLQAVTVLAGEMQRTQQRAEQLEAELAALKVERDSMQAKIDALMMEYCPDEMTPEQVEEWGKHQKPSPDQGDSNER